MIEVLFCLVIGITDGDTLKARCGIPSKYKDVRVRIAAVDTPEMHPEQPYGREAKEALAAICANKKVKITITQKTKSFKRIVGDAECDGVDSGTYLVKNGLAWVYPQFAKKHKHLHALQDEAKAAQRGLWVDKQPIAPWDWRKTHKNK